jgi:hypothetical protein
MNNKIKFQNAMITARFHASVLLKGIARTLYGSLIAVLFGVSFYGFVSIASEDGYLAVFDFIASVATFAVAVCNMYCIGLKKRSGKK